MTTLREVWNTPGHTPGGCCLLFPDAGFLVAGDTLFKGSCGRTDLPGGDPRQLKDSLNKLKQLPDETRVSPGTAKTPPSATSAPPISLCSSPAETTLREVLFSIP